VLVLAARYGSSGFFAGLIAATGAVAVGSVATGTVTSWSHIESGPNLIAFGACLIVSWIASWHLRRQANLVERLRELTEGAADADATIATLRDVVATLRTRVDRTSNSLSFLRNIAARLEGTDPVAAAEGAADLALARTGAAAATVKVGMGGRERFLAIRDARVPQGLPPLARDGAEVAVPIRYGGDQIGVITLLGNAGSALDDATVRDLAVIASWCGPAVASAARLRMPAARKAQEVL
jgi:uncharacterized coiled-coil protein SlyX